MNARVIPVLVLCAALSACSISPKPADSISKAPSVAQPSTPIPAQIDVRTAVRNFITVVQTVEPVAERACRESGKQMNCDFKILVDETVNAPPNAFQTVDATGRPVIAFTISLIVQAQNRDEIAFILAHEAAHHIQGHLQRQQQNASIGATIARMVFGQDRRAQQIGAALGARRFSKDFELEADALGTVIAARAGYDPIVGAAFFDRIPDPGNRFLGTHPANADRRTTVQRVAAGL